MDHHQIWNKVQEALEVQQNLVMVHQDHHHHEDHVKSLDHPLLKSQHRHVPKEVEVVVVKVVVILLNHNKKNVIVSLKKIFG